MRLRQGRPEWRSLNEAGSGAGVRAGRWTNGDVVSVLLRKSFLYMYVYLHVRDVKQKKTDRRALLIFRRLTSHVYHPHSLFMLDVTSLKVS